MANLLFTCSLAILITSCQPKTGPRPSTPTPLIPLEAITPTATFRPTYTPTPLPIGDPSNPLIIGFIKADPSEQQILATNDLANQLTSTLELQVNSVIFQSFVELEESLRQNQVHIAWLGPVEYIIASRTDALTASLITNHLGVTAYGIQYFAHMDTNFKSYFDITKDKSTASSGIALSQFSGMRPCLVQDNSLTSYWVPLGILKQANIPTLEPSFTNSTSASLRSLYIQGVCDFAVSYALTGDPRTATSLTTDLPDIMQKIIIIWRSEGVIPNLGVSINTALELPLQKQIQQALIGLSKTPEGLQLLTDANNYEISALEIVDDTTYDSLREILEVQNINIRRLIK